eukprot:CAMPEP_0116850602 /NCGR_PEP_ID=MMETSP0418-20121206/16249_1 /TAXON_ID=1158023 /ORGANISM="Astrosyne radiata, Strain 13vi08-1A" /LENGTH=123 /DNA_ID=CAMNT_0004482513 /DNA_START=27 /DNA_END=398 /DNA_ORIENTATION=-
MPKVKSADLAAKDKDELLADLDKLKGELATLRVTQVAQAAASKLAQIKVVRKNIARTLTAYNAQRRNEARLAYKDKKFVPKTLRPKQTRAIRRALTAEQKAKRVPRIAKRESNFPTRKFAVVA